MKNDFISIYTAIESKEQKVFANYIQCFYGNQKSILSVFEEVATASSQKKLDAIREASVDNKNRLNAFADLKKWLLEFLTIQEIRNNTTEAKLLGLEALHKRRLFDVYYQKSKQLIIELDKQQDPNLWDLFWKVRLSHINYFNIPIDRLQDYKADMMALLHDLDNFYMSAKLKYSAELYNRLNVLNEDYASILLQPILDLLTKEYKFDPIVKDIYWAMYQLTKEHSMDAYLKLKKFLVEKPHHDLFEKSAIVLYLLNFATGRLRKGDETFIQETFELFQLGIKQSLFTTSGYFLTYTFLNIVNTACRLEKYEWVNDFVENWSPHLIPTEREEVTYLAMARIAFEEKRFNDVISLLQNVKFKNFNFILNVRLLLLRAYYEQNSPTNLMLDYCNALYLYVYRSKQIGEALRINTINFIKMFRTLVSGKSKKQLYAELDKTHKSMLCYDWMKMKIEELPN